MPVNYQDGKVYTIHNDINDTIYTGSTAQRLLCSRMSCHRRNSKDETQTTGLYSAMRELGREHFHIILHHAFPCNSKDELVAEEMKTLDALISSGKSVYNNVIGGKHDDAAKAKISAAKKGKKQSDAMKAKMQGNKNSFLFGSIGLYSANGLESWRFQWHENGAHHSKTFSCKKFGDYGAFWRAEQARRKVYPEWGNEEDCTCDDFGEIEWD